MNIIDRLPGWIRFQITGNYRTQAEIVEFEATHAGGFNEIDARFLSTGEIELTVQSMWLEGQSWTGHGWCKKCDSLVEAAREASIWPFK